MSETAATPSGAPASVDDIVASLVREDDQREQSEAQAPVPEPIGSQEPETETQDEAPAPEPKYTVKVRGQEVEVTLDELRNGYSRTEDYKAKTAEVAEQRRAAEQARAEIAARAAKLDEVLQRAPLDPVLAAGQKTDWQALAVENPAEYVARKAAYEARVQQWQEIAQAREFAVRQAAERALVESEQRLREAVPDWADDGKRKELQAGIAKTLEAYGFTPDDYKDVRDHRVLLIARDAMLYRQQQEQRKSAEAKRASPPPPKTVAPGAAPSNQTNTKAKALLKSAAKSGRVDDQVNAILAALE